MYSHGVQQEKYSSRENSIPSEFQHFFSDDPYVVLGIEKGYTPSSLKTRVRALQKEYHPDKFPNDPEMARLAEEIFKRVQIAVANIDMFFPSGHTTEDAVRNAKRRSYERTDAEKKELFDSAVRNFSVMFVFSKEHFLQQVKQYEAFGMTRADFDAVFETEDFRTHFVDKINHEATLAGSSGKPAMLYNFLRDWDVVFAGVADFNLYRIFRESGFEESVKKGLISFGIKSDNPEMLSRLFADWSGYGVDTRTIVSDPDFIRLIGNRTVNDHLKSSGEAPSLHDVRVFCKHVKEWRYAGVNMDQAINSPQAREKFKNHIIGLINNNDSWGYDELKRIWTGMNIDFDKILNSGEYSIDRALNDKVNTLINGSLLKMMGKSKARDFIKDWTIVGWNPPEELIEMSR